MTTKRTAPVTRLVPPFWAGSIGAPLYVSEWHFRAFTVGSFGIDFEVFQGDHWAPCGFAFIAELSKATGLEDFHPRQSAFGRPSKRHLHTIPGSVVAEILVALDQHLAGVAP